MDSDPSIHEPGVPELAGGEVAPQGRVLRSASLLGAATICAKLGALAKDWLVARQLGAGDELDAYLIAFLIPSYTVAVLAHSLALAVVPAYVRLWRSEGLAAASRLAGNVLGSGTLALLVITAILLAAAGPIVSLLGWGFNPEKLALARSLFYLMAGVIVASGISAALAARLNAHQRFSAPAAAGVAIPLVTLAVYGACQGKIGVYALAGGTLAGFVAETGVLALVAWRQGLLPRPRVDLKDAQLRQVARQYLPAAAGSLLTSGSLLVDQALAASLGSGQVSILNYGSKVVSVVVAVIAASLSTVLFPTFSHLIAAGQWQTLRRTLSWYVRLVLLGSVPGLAVLALISEPTIRLLFERGAFTSETTAAVTAVQLWLLPQIPFAVLAMLAARALSALEGNATLFRIGAMNLAVNVVGDYVLMRWFGVRGIAMATSLVYVLAAAVTLWTVRARLREVSR